MVNRPDCIQSSANKYKRNELVWLMGDSYNPGKDVQCEGQQIESHHDHVVRFLGSQESASNQTEPTPRPWRGDPQSFVWMWQHSQNRICTTGLSQFACIFPIGELSSCFIVIHSYTVYTPFSDLPGNLSADWRRRLGAGDLWRASGGSSQGQGVPEQAGNHQVSY